LAFSSSSDLSTPFALISWEEAASCNPCIIGSGFLISQYTAASEAFLSFIKEIRWLNVIIPEAASFHHWFYRKPLPVITKELRQIFHG
jgi:hypothetical protein